MCATSFEEAAQTALNERASSPPLPAHHPQQPQQPQRAILFDHSVHCSAQKKLRVAGQVSRAGGVIGAGLGIDKSSARWLRDRVDAYLDSVDAVPGNGALR